MPFSLKLMCIENTNIEPPAYLDGAEVIQWAWSGDKPFGIIKGENGTPKVEIFGLAICKYHNKNEYYRFSCSQNWEVEQDAQYKSVEDAIALLPSQYQNVEREWYSKSVF